MVRQEIVLNGELKKQWAVGYLDCSGLGGGAGPSDVPTTSSGAGSEFESEHRGKEPASGVLEGLDKRKRERDEATLDPANRPHLEFHRIDSALARASLSPCSLLSLNSNQSVAKART